MLRRLFTRLTGDPARGQAMFTAAVALARRPAWFTRAGVADTVEGRFAVLATVTALMIVRLEAEGAAGESASVALTERFVESIDAEVREMGVSDPAIGKQVRRLVGALANRVSLWRSATREDGQWEAAAKRSLFPGGGDGDAPDPAVDEARRLWQQLEGSGLDQIVEGRLP